MCTLRDKRSEYVCVLRILDIFFLKKNWQGLYLSIKIGKRLCTSLKTKEHPPNSVPDSTKVQKNQRDSMTLHFPS
jgi:hypothetical protein